jgi:hypothetical protein
MGRLLRTPASSVRIGDSITSDLDRRRLVVVGAIKETMELESIVYANGSSTRGS